MDVSPRAPAESGPRRPRVLLAASAPLMRAAEEDCLREHGFAVSGTAEDAAAVVGLALRERPDVILIDTDLPGGGIRAAEDLVFALPAAAVVMMADGPTEADVLDAVRAGAVGCLPKDISREGLARALAGVLKGETALPRALVGAVLTEITAPDVKPVYGGAWERASALSVRELEVLRLLAHGASTADIARQLSISPITARRHCAGICRKLGVSDRKAAVELVRRSHLSLAGRP
jgi:DNA-binding NarL/FixJ family response regulator